MYRSLGPGDGSVRLGAVVVAVVIVVVAAGCSTPAPTSGPPPPPAGPHLVDTVPGRQSCAIRSNGTVGCFGFNDWGQLGDGTRTNSAAATTVPGITDAVSVTTGYNFSCALRSTGRVSCWGDNYYHELLPGGAGFYTTPVDVGLATVAAISAGYEHLCFLFGNGAVRCRGNNSRGELGNGLLGVSTDTNVAGLTAKRIAASDQTTCAIRTTGAVVCWGNQYTLDPNPPLGFDAALTPRTIGNLTNAKEIELTGGLGTPCVVLADTTTRCWGPPPGGGPVPPLDWYEKIPGLTGVVENTGGCAVFVDGTVDCYHFPTKPDPFPFESLTGVADLSELCARLSDGGLQCWLDTSHDPVPVPGW